MSLNMNVEMPRLATQDDLLRAVIALECLPKRASENVSVELQVYQIALEGDAAGNIVVTANDLAMAVRRIIQGVLGHGFHPSPSELRMICDKVRDERCEVLARHARQHRLRQEAASYNTDGPTPEQRARVAAKYARFCREWDGKGKDEEAEIEAIRAKYDPALLATIPDLPVASTWSRAGGGHELSTSPRDRRGEVRA